MSHLLSFLFALFATSALADLPDDDAKVAAVLSGVGLWRSVLRTNCLHQIHDPASHIGVFNLRE